MLSHLAWTLLHFLWQGALVAALVAAGLSLEERASTRRALALAGLVAMAALPLLTLLGLSLGGAPAGLPGLPTTQLPLVHAAVVSLWGAGVVVLSARLLLSWARLEWVRHRSISAPPEWTHRFEELVTRMGASTRVRLRLVSGGLVPMAAGILRPVVLVPASLLTQLSTAQLQALLAHELAHLRRWDPAFQVLLALVETVLFFHPAVWWLSGVVREEREFAADELAAAVLGRGVLARALVELESHRLDTLQLVAAASGGSLGTRIRRVLGLSIPRRRGRALPLFLGLGLLSLASVLAVASPPTWDEPGVLYALDEPEIELHLLGVPTSGELERRRDERVDREHARDRARARRAAECQLRLEEREQRRVERRGEREIRIVALKELEELEQLAQLEALDQELITLDAALELLDVELAELDGLLSVELRLIAEP